MKKSKNLLKNIWIFFYLVHISHFFILEMKYLIWGAVRPGNSCLEKCSNGEILFGKLIFEEMSIQGIVHSGSCLSGNCLSGNVFRELFVWEISVGEKSVGDMVNGEMSWYQFKSCFTAGFILIILLLLFYCWLKTQVDIIVKK